MPEAVLFVSQSTPIVNKHSIRPQCRSYGGCLRILEAPRYRCYDYALWIDVAHVAVGKKLLHHHTCYYVNLTTVYAPSSEAGVVRKTMWTVLGLVLSMLDLFPTSGSTDSSAYRCCR